MSIKFRVKQMRSKYVFFMNSEDSEVLGDGGATRRMEPEFLNHERERNLQPTRNAQIEQFHE